jgi:hypothetical protein
MSGWIFEGIPNIPFNQDLRFAEAIYATGGHGCKDAKSIGSMICQIKTGTRRCPDLLWVAMESTIRETMKAEEPVRVDEAVEAAKNKLASIPRIKQAISPKEFMMRLVAFTRKYPARKGLFLALINSAEQYDEGTVQKLVKMALGTNASLSEQTCLSLLEDLSKNR